MSEKQEIDSTYALTRIENGWNISYLKRVTITDGGVMRTGLKSCVYFKETLQEAFKFIEAQEKLLNPTPLVKVEH
jgi:hypothetical protein